MSISLANRFAVPVITHYDSKAQQAGPIIVDRASVEEYKRYFAREYRPSPRGDGTIAPAFRLDGFVWVTMKDLPPSPFDFTASLEEDTPPTRTFLVTGRG